MTFIYAFVLLTFKSKNTILFLLYSDFYKYLAYYIYDLEINNYKATRQLMKNTSTFSSFRIYTAFFILSQFFILLPLNGSSEIEYLYRHL